MEKKLLYWSPCLNKVGTFYSTINSAISVSKYSRGLYKPVIINSCGEWDSHKEFFNKQNVEVISFYKKNYFKLLPKEGFFFSRFSYIIISILSFLPLLNLLRKNQDSIMIIHLITSLPMIILKIFNINIKIILRLSGHPKLNYLRYKFWKLSGNKISYITCPTEQLMGQLKDTKVFDSNKILFLQDAVLKVNQSNNKKIKINKNKYILAAGRLTVQKNFTYLLNEFSNFLKINRDYKLIILGNGEERNKLKKIIEKKNISDHVFLKGFVDNIQDYMFNSDIFVLSSLWEDPGFVIIEAAYNNLFVISSDCPNGPKEILDNGRGGILFKSNEEGALLNSLIEFDKLSLEEKYYKKVILKKNISKYTIFKHYKKLETILKKMNT